MPRASYQRKKRAKPSGFAVGYTRVSTREQGLSREAQEAAIRAFAQRNGLSLRTISHDEGVSGAAPLMDQPDERARGRAGIRELLAELQNGDVLIVAKRDRLGRDLAEIALFERALGKRGIRVISAAGEGTASDAPGQVLMRHVLDAVAQYERTLIGQRIRAALQAKIARGERAGNVPFGFCVEPGSMRLVPNEVEQRVIALVLAAREQRTQRAAMWQLRKDGVVSPRSGKSLGLRQLQEIWRRHGLKQQGLPHAGPGASVQRRSRK